MVKDDDMPAPVAPRAPAAVASGDLLVAEHMDEASLKKWQRAAFLGRFKAEGVHIYTRMSAAEFEKRLHQALHDPI